MALQKCLFNIKDGRHAPVHCHFNPEQLSLSKSNSWSECDDKGNKIGQLFFQGEGRRDLSLTLYFDTYEETSLRRGGAKDVRDDTHKLLLLTHPTQQGSRGPRPPHVQFVWGSFRWPESHRDHSESAVITSYSEAFTLFAEDGTPLRAKVTVGLRTVDPPAGGQNPTSLATGAGRIRVVQPGDTLDLLASQELGAAGSWRQIAELNGLEDPRRLRPGQVLPIPSEV